ncbi:MAG: flagellin [Gammaproteobacteria bacterium]|nr:flagellin [Gammaproteobacteria bacterium]
MSLVLNTNLNSLNAQNGLASSGGKLATALQQLSSGLRINTAADDSAGYAIVQGMTSQINGLNQAARNAADGVSLSQTASGSLSEIISDLQTMRDLAVQSLNATNSAQDRINLDQQFQQLKADISNVAQTASFNGVRLLDGSFQGATFQVGANAGNTISVGSVADARASNLGKLYSDAGGTLSATAGKWVAGDKYTFNYTDAASNKFSSSEFTMTGNAATDLKTIAAAVNQLSSSDGGLVATVNTGGTGIVLSSTTSQTTTGTFAYVANANNSKATGAGAAAMTDFGISAATAIAVTTAGKFLDSAAVTSVDSSNLVLAQIDSALQQVVASGAQLGAYQNRFQAAITGINTNATNLSAARSQIQDTNYAQATSDLSKAQILQQAGTAMVAQANTVPQNVLTLLQKLP